MDYESKITCAQQLQANREILPSHSYYFKTNRKPSKTQFFTVEKQHIWSVRNLLLFFTIYGRQNKHVDARTY